MPGLTQADVTPNAVEEEEQEEQKDQGYQWGRWLTNPGNELRFIGKGIQNLWNDTEKKLLEASNTPGIKAAYPIAPGVPIIYERDDGSTTTADPTGQEIVAGVQEATVDVPLQGISLGQQFYEEETADLQGREAVQTDTRDFNVGPVPVGALLEDSKDNFAEFMGAPKRYELGDGSITRDISSNITSTVYTAVGLSKLGLTPGAKPTAFTGMRVNPLVSKFQPSDLVQVKGPWGAYWRANPEWARTAAQWLSFGGLESFGVTLISDQTEAGYADPGDSQATATLKSLIPNAGQELALGAGLLAPAGVAKAANAASQLPGFLGKKSSIARTRKAAAVAQEVKNARKWTTDNGLQTETPDGAYEFTAQDPWTTKPVTAEQVKADIDATVKASEGAAPATPRQALDQLEGQPRVEIESAWDSELPEIDTIKRALDQLDPIELRQIAVQLEDGQALVNALSRRLDNVEQGLGEVELGSPVVWPEGGNIPIEAMFMSFDTAQLRAMAKANPAMAAMLRANGLSPLTASRTQMIQSLVDLQKKGAPIAAPVKAPETAIPPAEADGLKAGILRRAIENGEVRPSATEIPDLPEPPAKDPSDMTVAEQLIEDDRLSGEWTQIDNAKAEQNLRETREADGYYQKSEAEQAAAGKYDGWDEPSSELEAAGRSLTAKGAQGRDVGAAQQMEGWLNIGRPDNPLIKNTDEAIAIVRRKGKYLDTDRIPGLDINQAINDRSMGRYTDEVKKVQRALKDFYGIDDPSASVDPDAMMSAGGPELPRIQDPLESDIAEMMASLEAMANDRVNKMQVELRGVAEQIFGKDEIPAFDFNKYPAMPEPMPKAWGGDGKKMASRGGRYEPLRDVIEVNELLNKKLEGSFGLREVMAHESWHRIQAGYLTPKQSKVLNSVFGKQDVNWFSGLDSYYLRTVQPIELQAVAFQSFYSMRRDGIDRMDLLREGITQRLDQQFPMKRGSWKRKLTIEALSVLREGWERILQFRNRAMNYIEGNGFQNVYDIFNEAYQGRLTAGRKMESFAQIMAEAERIPDMSPEEFGRWVKENPDFERKYIDAGVRQDYWNLWAGRANKTIAKLDSDIAALKQQAIDGGC